MFCAPFENYGQCSVLKEDESLRKQGWSATENHCTSVNFPLVSPPAREGRMAARLLEYAVLYVFVNERTRGRRRAQGERTRERDAYIYEHTHTSAHVSQENSTGRSICMLVFSRSWIFPPFEFRLRCGRPITKKFLTTSFPPTPGACSATRYSVPKPRSRISFTPKIKVSVGILVGFSPKLNQSIWR